MKVICNKCGKEAPRDTEKSNAQWNVYETKEPCECGGKFVPEFLVKDFNFNKEAKN